MTLWLIDMRSDVTGNNEVYLVHYVGQKLLIKTPDDPEIFSAHALALTRALDKVCALHRYKCVQSFP